MLIILVFAAAILLSGVADGDVDVEASIQYATVLVSGQYVPAQTIPSPFLGICYLTLTLLDKVNKTYSEYTVDVILYHNIEFAKRVDIKGAAAKGSTGMLIYSLHTTGSASGIYSPFRKSFVATQSVVTAFYDSLMYVEVTSAGEAAGQIRGQFQRRADDYIALIDGGADGLAAIQLYDIGHPHGPAFYVGMNFWMLSRVAQGQQIVGLAADTGYINVTMGTLPDPPPTISELSFTHQFSIQQGVIIVASPLWGQGSSHLQLAYLAAPADNIVFLANFTRLPDGTETDQTPRVRSSASSLKISYLQPSILLFFFLSSF